NVARGESFVLKAAHAAFWLDDYSLLIPTKIINYCAAHKNELRPIGRIFMPEVILAGASGRIEARYSAGKTDNAPIALILHPHPKAGGHMNNPVTVQLFHLFMTRGFSVLRFNFRGVNKSQGEFDSGIGE